MREIVPKGGAEEAKMLCISKTGKWKSQPKKVTARALVLRKKFSGVLITVGK